MTEDRVIGKIEVQAPGQRLSGLNPCAKPIRPILPGAFGIKFGRKALPLGEKNE